MLQLTAAGLEIQTLSEITDDINARIRSSVDLGPEMRLESGGVLFDIVAVFAKRERLYQEALLDVFNAFSRTSAEGSNLDNVGSMVFVDRPLATRSTVLQTLTGTPATAIPELSRVRIPSGAIFRTTEATTIGGGGTVDVNVESEDTGPIEGGAGLISEIVDGIPGWTSTTNALDAEPGRERFTDPEYRDYIVSSQQTGETATEQAIRTNVEKVKNVLTVLAKSNRSQVTAPDGTPRNNVRVIVWPTTIDTEAVALAIWEKIPAGIDSYGTDVSHTITDSQGQSQLVRFDFATELDLYLSIAVVTTTGFPTDGEAQIRAAVEELSNAMTPNRDFLPIDLECLITLIPGIREVEVLAGLAPGPTLNDPVVTLTDELVDLDGDAPRTVVNIT